MPIEETRLIPHSKVPFLLNKKPGSDQARELPMNTGSHIITNFPCTFIYALVAFGTLHDLHRREGDGRQCHETPYGEQKFVATGFGGWVPVVHRVLPHNRDLFSQTPR